MIFLTLIVVLEEMDRNLMDELSSFAARRESARPRYWTQLSGWRTPAECGS
jgi:hypothetical protein